MIIIRNMAFILGVILFIKNNVPVLDMNLLYKIGLVGLIGLFLIYVPKYLNCDKKINFIFICITYPLLISIIIYSNLLFAISIYLFLYVIHFEKIHKVDVKGDSKRSVD